MERYESMIEEGKIEEAKRALLRAEKYGTILEKEVSPDIERRARESSFAVREILGDLEGQMEGERWDEVKGMIEDAEEGENNIAIENAPHEILFGGRGAENFLFNISGKLTHPGDSLQFSESHYVLALPVQAPWGSFVASVEKAIALKPKIVIPIHDWHWKDTARRRMYETAKQYLAGKGIEFHGLETGEMLEI